jgi:two-component system, cell cycle response regulator
MYGRILIVDDVATNRIIYKVKLGDAFYEPLLAADGKACLEIARSERPDLILLDLMLPDMPGTDVLRHLRADPVTRAIPVIVLTASRDVEMRLDALSAGADDVMTKPVPDQVLMARVRNLLRARGETGIVSSTWGMPAHAVLGLEEAPAVFEKAGTIAILSSHPERDIVLKQEMQGLMRDKLVVMSRDQALAIVPTTPTMARGVPDVFLISSDLDGNDGGLRLMSELKSRPATRHAVVCIITAGDDAALPAVAYDLGADDVVETRTPARELVCRIRILLRRKRQDDLMRATVEDGLRLAVIDPLTGIYNRRYALPRLAGIAAQASQAETDFAVMVVDLDRFKSVNDRFGHAAGDAVLIEVARRLSDNLRISDLLARIGGEEFLVALPETSFADAEHVAERLCAVISDTPVQLPSGQGMRVTASIGVALGSGALHRTEDVAVLIDRADQALMQSKHAGRNQVTFSLSAA